MPLKAGGRNVPGPGTAGGKTPDKGLKADNGPKAAGKDVKGGRVSPAGASTGLGKGNSASKLKKMPPQASAAPRLRSIRGVSRTPKGAWNVRNLPPSLGSY